MRRKQSEILKQVWQYIGKYRFYLAISIVLSLVVVAGTLYAPILVGRAIDSMAESGRVNFSAVKQILQQLIGVMTVTALSQWLMNLLNNRIAFHVSARLRTDVFTKLHRLPVKFLDGHAHGDLVSRVIADVDQFSDGLLLGFGQLFTGLVTIMGTLIYMLSMNPIITFVVVCLTPMSLVVANYIAKSTFSLFQRQSEIRGEQTAFVEEMVGNKKVVQAFGREKACEQHFAAINEQLEACSVKAVFFSSITNPCTRFINSMVYAAVALAGAFAVLYGGITIGELSAFLSYAKQYTKPFNEISGVIAELQNAIACVGRVFEILEEEEQTQDREDGIVLEAAEGAVDFQSVSFSYHENQKLIRDLSLNIKPGERIAIVGPTGCGKTTLINLLMRFYDVTKGRILVDGEDIRDITRSSLRSNYGMLLQETWLKEGTVVDNIRIGRKDASGEEIAEAARLAFADGFINRLPQGYDTYLSEDGGGLSQGQKQLICIARIMLSHPSMLILDEATSFIDIRTEMKIQEAFERLMKGRTSFLVAHRLSTIQNADQILVMREGAIVEQGTHEQLLGKKGFYYQLYYSR